MRLINTSATHLTLSLIGILFLNTCAEPCPEQCGRYCGNAYISQFSYTIHPEFLLSNGIMVDTSGQDIDLKNLETLTNEIIGCVQDFFYKQSFIITNKQKESMYCAYNNIPVSPILGCLVIKFPSDFLISMDGKTQVLPYLAPPELCIAKGLIPTKEFPCRWRAGIQDHLTVVTTPDMTDFGEHFIRILTGCNYIWSSQELSTCATL